MNSAAIQRYEICGIRLRTDYSFVLRSIHDHIDSFWEGEEESGMRKRAQLFLTYNPKKGILTFATKRKVNPSELGVALSQKGLALRILK